MPLLKMFALLPALVLQTPENPPAPIVIDGQFDDWAAVTDVHVDPLDAEQAPLDITTIRITHDEAFVHIFADLTREVCIQQLGSMLHFVIDGDGNAETGAEVHELPGADIVITMSPLSRSHGETRNMGVGLVSLTFRPDPEQVVQGGLPPISPYDVGFTFGPTYASAHFEFRMQRGVQIPQTPMLFAGDSMRLKLVHTDAEGRMLDTTVVMEHALTTALGKANGVPNGDNGTADPLLKADASHLRVVSLNAQHSKLVQDAERAGRVMKALAPDVLLLQELTDRTRPDEVESLLNRCAPPVEGRWHVHIGEGGGNLRCGVATHLPHELVEELKLVSYPDRPDRYIRTAALVIQHQEHRLLATSVHLRCCGGATGEEEETRRIEVAELRSRIDPLRVRLDLDGLVVGGDFNLVGTREPLDMMCLLGDFDGSHLTAAQPLQLDGRSNATWADRLQPFVPGRLDYFVTSDSTLVTQREFVFDSADLPSRWLEEHGLTAEDATLLSDHRPLVIDLAWAAPKASAATP